MKIKEKLNFKSLKCVCLWLVLMCLAGCSSVTDNSTTSKVDIKNEAFITEKTEDAILETEENPIESNIGTTDKVTINETLENTSIDNEVNYTPAEIHFINTGNSDSILIKQENCNILIDGGDNDDESMIVSYLKNQGVTTLEYVIATHPHADHIGGLDAVINNIKVNNVLVSNGSSDSKTYVDFITALANKGLNPSVPLKGAIFNLTSSSSMEIVSCANVQDANNQSIVVLYRNGNDKVLFTGDAELDILNNINTDIDVDLLKVSHHGSSNGLSQSFLNKTTPEFSVITCGTGNTYGHPHQETVSLLKNNSIPRYRTDEGGDIIFYSTGNGLYTNNSPNSYNPGENSIYKENNNSNYQTNNNQTNDTTENNTSNSNEKTVYWTPNGSVYHTDRNCQHLKNSKTVLSGSISESNKERQCKNCP